MKNKTTFLIPLFMVALLVVFSCQSGIDKNPSIEEQRILANLIEPEFPDKEFLVTDFGAKEENLLNTLFIQNTIDSCSVSGGGKVIIPKGRYQTGALHLKNNVNLHLMEGAVLLFSTNPKEYLPLVRTRWEGMDLMNYSPLIYANQQENIALTGKGILDGQANDTNWWIWKGKTEYGWNPELPSQAVEKGKPLLQKYEREETPVEERIFGEGSYLRPQFINFVHCRNILIEDITLKNAPFWIIHPLLSENITIRGVTTISHGPNNDGCDPESSKNILIENCFFDTGDDCIAIKSGRNKDGRRAMAPSENILIRNCNMKNGHGGVVIGSEISGGARNIFVKDCRMDSPDLERAIRIKTNSNRGGVIENMHVENITIGEVREAILKINCEYDIKNEGIDKYIPLVKNIYLKEITSKKSKYPIYLKGIDGENCIDSIFISNCHFKGVREEAYMKYTGLVTMEKVKIGEQN